MEKNKPTLGVLLGDPSGIGPELVSKLLSHKEIEKANIVVIGEKNVLHEANKLTGNNCDLEYVESYEQVKFNVKNKFFRFLLSDHLISVQWIMRFHCGDLKMKI